MALVHSHPGGLRAEQGADPAAAKIKAHCAWLVCRVRAHSQSPLCAAIRPSGRRFEHGVTDCYTLFRDAYHLAGTEMPDFHREDDWWRNGQNLYPDNMAVTGFYRVPLSSAQAGDILLCCFGASVPNHAAIYCGNGELLHHLPEQLSKRERYSEKMATTNAFCLASPPLARICLHGDLQRFGRRLGRVCEHGSGSHSRPVDADAGLSPIR